jgi:syntaxin 1B/2/3
MVTKLDEETSEVVKHTKGANVELAKGVASARRARKLKWILCGICFVVVLALVIGLVIWIKVIKPQQEAALKKAKGEPAKGEPA